MQVIGRCSYWCLLLLSIASGCDHARERTEVHPVTERSEATKRSALREQLRRDLALVRQRFDAPLQRVNADQRVRCPDELLPRGEQRVILRVRDVRKEAKTLLPLALRASLETAEFSRLGGYFHAGAAALWDDDQLEPRDEAAAAAALAELKALLAVRFLAELHVDSYSTPSLFRRRAAPRSEWAPGQLAGLFVIRDLSEGKILCQAPLHVRPDVHDAPVRRRLREATRQRLEQRLQEGVWQAMHTALASMSSVLVMPEASERDDASHRWAAALTSDARVVQSNR